MNRLKDPCKVCPCRKDCTAKDWQRQICTIRIMILDPDKYLPEKLMCKVFYCDRQKDRFFCYDCPLKNRCSNPCENHPSRCRLVDDGGRVKPTEVRKVRAVDLWAKE